MNTIRDKDGYLRPDQGRFARYLIFYRRNRAILFLTILIILFTVLAVIIHSGDTLSFDVRVTDWVQAFSTPGLDRMMELISYLGSVGVIILAAVLAALFFVSVEKYKTALIVMVSLLAYPLNVLIKDLIERSRPLSPLVRVLSPNTGFSFPSGHAMISMTVYGVIAYMFWVYLTALRPRLLVAILASLIILVVGLSRIYLGAHWLTDVTGGWIAGLVLVLGLAEIHRLITTPAAPTPTAPI